MGRRIWQNIRNNKNWGKWSDIVTVMLPDIILCETKLQNIMSMRLFEWLVILVGCTVYGIKSRGK